MNSRGSTLIEIVASIAILTIVSVISLSVLVKVVRSKKTEKLLRNKILAATCLEETLYTEAISDTTYSDGKYIITREIEKKENHINITVKSIWKNDNSTEVKLCYTKPIKIATDLH